MSGKKLLVVGELNVDLLLNDIEGFPKVGTEIIANILNFTLGSSSAIFASNSSSMGVETSFCGVLGEDEFGSFILKELRDKNVDVQYIKQTSEIKTGITVVMNYDQDRANVTYCGAMRALTIDDIPWKEIKKFSHFHLSNFFLQNGIKNDIIEIFKKAKAAGLTTSLDLQWDPADQWDFDYKSCLPYVDVFLPNKAEILALTKKDTLEEAENEVMQYANILALKLGKEGAKLRTKDINHFLPPYLNNTYKDSIGAGDSFNAGFIHKYLEGNPLEECLDNANLMGSLNTLKRGGTNAFTSIEAIAQQKQQILNKKC